MQHAGLKRAARTLLAGNGRKNDAKNRHLRTIAQLCRAVSSQLRQVSTIGTRWLYCVECPQYSTRRRSACNIYIVAVCYV